MDESLLEQFRRMASDLNITDFTEDNPGPTESDSESVKGREDDSVATGEESSGRHHSEDELDGMPNYEDDELPDEIKQLILSGRLGFSGRSPIDGNSGRNHMDIMRQGEPSEEDIMRRIREIESNSGNDELPKDEKVETGEPDEPQGVINMHSLMDEIIEKVMSEGAESRNIVLEINPKVEIRFNNSIHKDWLELNRFKNYEFYWDVQDGVNLKWDGTVRKSLPKDATEEIKKSFKERFYPYSFVWQYGLCRADGTPYSIVLSEMERPPVKLLIWTRRPDIMEWVKSMEDTLKIGLYDEDKQGIMVMILDFPEYPLWKNNSERDRKLANMMLVKQLILIPKSITGSVDLERIFIVTINPDLKSKEAAFHMFDYFCKRMLMDWERRNKRMDLEIDNIISKYNPFMVFLNNRRDYMRFLGID